MQNFEKAVLAIRKFLVKQMAVCGCFFQFVFSRGNNLSAVYAKNVEYCPVTAPSLDIAYF